jgi:citrate lyase synthetase
MSSNPFAAASTPFISRSAKANDLFQMFVVDPAESNVPNFKPNFVAIPLGADITSLGVSVPGSRGIDPGKRHSQQR